MRMVVFRFFLFCICCLAVNQFVVCQQTRIHGVVLDADNLEPISFAPVQFTQSGIGKIADQNGTFDFGSTIPSGGDTLQFSYVGYQPYQIFVQQNDSVINKQALRILLQKATMQHEVIVKSKFTKSFLLWRKIVKHKDKNNFNHLPYYTYDMHNRLELSLNDINKDQLEKSKFLKSVKFLLKNTDSSEFGKTTLPFFITETLSKLFYQKNPYQKREEIQAILSSGIKNESFLKLLGGSYQNLNFYENQITFFNKEFISPFSTQADVYYNFKILDTQYVQQQRLIHFLFIPKLFADNVFDGDCWVRDSIYAIQKINLRLTNKANINFVNKANFMQELQPINDSTYFLKKVSFVAEVAPTEGSKLDFLVRRIATYKDVTIDKNSALVHLQKNQSTEEIVLLDSAKQHDKTYWNANRHEPLTKSETLAHATIDTLFKMPFFIRLVNGLQLLQSGFLDVGKFKIGKWWSILGRNPYNGPRIRLELANNEKLSKNFNFHLAATLNSRQQLWNGGIVLKYIFNHRYWSEVNWIWSDNVDLGFYDNQPSIVSKDNVFVNILKRKSVQFSLHNIMQTRLAYEKIYPNGLGLYSHIDYQQFIPIVRKDVMINDGDNTNVDYEKIKFVPDKLHEMKNASFTVGLSYRHLEKWIENNFRQISLGSQYPIVKASFTQGVAGIFGSQYDYQKVQMQLQQTIKKEPWGSFVFFIDAGKYWGTAPYMVLERPFSNLTMYDIKHTFNTVQPFEFIADSYTKLHFEHRMGKGLLRFIPYIKKLKWRQIWLVNAMIGGLSEQNQKHALQQHHRVLSTLQEKPLVEIGTGIDNIFNLFRVSYFWRLSPTASYSANTFMFSFHLQF